MEVRKFIKKTLQILASVVSCLFLLAIPASLVFVAIGSKVGTIVMLSLTLLSLVFVSVAVNAVSLEEASEASYGKYREEDRKDESREEDVNENIVSESEQDIKCRRASERSERAEYKKRTERVG